MHSSQQVNAHVLASGRSQHICIIAAKGKVFQVFAGVLSVFGGQTRPQSL